MNRKIIPCLVRDEYILGSGGVIGAEGSGGDVALELEFGAMWEGLVKYVTFRNALGEDPETVLVTADLMELRERPPKIATASAEAPCPALPEVRAVYLVPVPAKAKAVAGEMTVTVRGFAVSEDGTETEAALVAATARFRVLPGKWALPESEGFASPTAAQQLQAEIERIQGDIVAAAKAADAKEAAQQSAAQAAQDAEKAQAAQTGAEAAQEAAESAQAEAENAQAEAEKSKQWAGTYASGAQAAKTAAEAAQTAAEGAADRAEENKEFIRMTGEALGRDMRQFSMSMGNSVRVAQEAADDAREKAAQAVSSAGAAQTWAGKALEQADRAQEKAESSLEQADRAKQEADRAQAIAGGDFVTDPELDRALANMGVAPLVGPAELVGELLPGGVLFITDEALPEDYAVTLEQLLAEGDKAYAGQADELETLLTVGVAKALGLRSDGEGSEYTLATLPSLRADIRALCALAQVGGGYVLDGKTAVSHRQVQYYILHKTLVSQAVAEGENWGWMTDPRTEMGAIRREMAQLRALVGDVEPGIAQEEADGRYLKLTGGKAKGAYEFTGDPEELTGGSLTLSGFGSAVRSLTIEKDYLLVDGEPDGGAEFHLYADGCNVLGFHLKNEDALVFYPDGRTYGRIVAALGENTILQCRQDPIDDVDIVNLAYLKRTINSAVGDIGTILDSVNGEVI